MLELDDDGRRAHTGKMWSINHGSPPRSFKFDLLSLVSATIWLEVSGQDWGFSSLEYWLKRPSNRDAWEE